MTFLFDFILNKLTNKYFVLKICISVSVIVNIGAVTALRYCFV